MSIVLHMHLLEARRALTTIRQFDAAISCVVPFLLISLEYWQQAASNLASQGQQEEYETDDERKPQLVCGVLYWAIRDVVDPYLAVSALASCMFRSPH